MGLYVRPNLKHAQKGIKPKNSRAKMEVSPSNGLLEKKRKNKEDEGPIWSI